MKRKIVLGLVCFIMILSFIPKWVYGDIGPKPSVEVKFKGLEKEKYYVTLLSKESSTGPHRAAGEKLSRKRDYESEQENEVWWKFFSYEDKDGFYFLQYFEECTDTSLFKWGYYPPSDFKVLVYFPEKDSYVVTEKVYERYAFDSYYEVDMSGLEVGMDKQINHIEAEKKYDYKWELISLFARIIATIAIEMLVALIFGFKGRKVLLTIVIVNVITQSILNILLNIINYHQGSMAFVFNYVWMEIVVFIIEACIYSRYIKIFKGEKTRGKGFVVLYALVANTASFFGGMYIAHLIPAIF